MTTPAPARTGYAYRGVSLSRFFLFAGTVLFVLAAFAAGGHPLAGISDLPWAFGGFAAWVLSGAT